MLLIGAMGVSGSVSGFSAHQFKDYYCFDKFDLPFIRFKA